MKTVTAREAQQGLNQVIKWVEEGEEVVITRRGKKLVKLTRYEAVDDRPVKVPDFRKLRQRWGVEGEGGENAVLAERASSL